MALPNPTINAPLLSSAAAARRSYHGRSVSHSPVRIDPRDHDPLLRSLSPTTTLRAFSIDPTRDNDDTTGFPSLYAATGAERALGIKAAEACLQLRSWAQELQSWEWSGSFDPPQSVREQIRTLRSEQEAKQVSQWVCLPMEVVLAREKRLDEVSQSLEDIDVEELKDFALSAHYPSTPAGSQSSGLTRTMSQPLSRLEDVTTLITATILQALPYLSRVIALLNSWNIRISICKRAPSYLWDLINARLHLNSCWRELAAQETAERGIELDHETVRKMRMAVEAQVSSLGKKLDRFLDELEGHDETVPDFWIDDFEELEQKYGEWTVQAERAVLQSEWARNRLRRPEQSATIVSNPAAVAAAQATVPSQTIPFAPQESTVISRNSGGTTKTSLENVRPPSRHVPIVIDTYGDGQSYDKSLASSNPVPELTESAWSRQNRLPSQSPDGDSPQNTVAKIRSAFINGEIEKAESLQKQSKSPVRPFEHASTAFTRLFKRDKEKTNALARSDSSLSNRSNRSVTSSFRGDQGYSPSPSPVPNPRSATATSQMRETPVSNRSVPAAAMLAHRSPSPGSPLGIVTSEIPVRRSMQSTRDVEYVVPRSPPPETYRPTGAAPKSPKTYQPTRASPSKHTPEDWPLTQQSDDEPALSPSSPLHGIRELAVEDSSIRDVSPLPPSAFRLKDDFTLDIDGGVSPTQSGARSPSIGVSPHRAIQRPRSALALLTQPEVVNLDGLQEDDVDDFKPANIRRASYASIESHPRSAVRSVTLSRRTSMTGKTPPLSPTESRSASAVRPGGEERGQTLDFPSPPIIAPDPFSQPSDNEVGDRLTLVPSVSSEEAENDYTESPVLGRGGKIPPLDGHAMKFRQPGNSRPSSKRHAEPEPDTFDRHVSEVLQTLHSNIKFRTRPGAETPLLPSRAQTPEPRGLINGKTRATRAASGTQRAVTIAPAEASPKKSSAAAEPVKLYHLRQEGREEPIKLFVRLVGEGERVMVRVGGGWADLADYLRQYAEHHGSRTTSASGNDLEMLTSDPVAAAKNANGIRKVSDPIETPKGRRPSTPDISAREQDWLEDPQPRFTMGDSDEDSPEASNQSTVSTTTTTSTPVTTTTSTFSTYRGTPRSVSSTKDSRPTTSDQNTPTHPNTLAGPASAKRAAGLPDHKARWVEGMIEKAKASAEKDKNEREKYFTEMGKVGGTKRVIFNRSSSGTGSNK